MQVNLEEHADVKEFLNAEDPTVQTIAKAYFARDNIMNLDFVKQKEHNLKKLGYTNEQITLYLNSKVKMHLNSLVDKFMSNPSKDAQYNFLDEFNTVMSSKETTDYIKTRNERF